MNSSFVGDKGGANVGRPANSRGRIEANSLEHDDFSLISQHVPKLERRVAEPDAARRSNGVVITDFKPVGYKGKNIR